MKSNEASFLSGIGAPYLASTEQHPNDVDSIDWNYILSNLCVISNSPRSALANPIRLLFSLFKKSVSETVEQKYVNLWTELVILKVRACSLPWPITLVFFGVRVRLNSWLILKAYPKRLDKPESIAGQQILWSILNKTSQLISSVSFVRSKNTMFSGWGCSQHLSWSCRREKKNVNRGTAWSCLAVPR